MLEEKLEQKLKMHKQFVKNTATKIVHAIQVEANAQSRSSKSVMEDLSTPFEAMFIKLRRQERSLVRREEANDLQRFERKAYEESTLTPMRLAIETGFAKLKDIDASLLEKLMDTLVFDESGYFFEKKHMSKKRELQEDSSGKMKEDDEDDEDGSPRKKQKMKDDNETIVES